MIKPFINADTIEARVKELAKQIENDYKDEEITFICILKGSIYFFTDLTRNIKNESHLEFMRVASYGSGTTSGEIHLKLDLSTSIENKNVIIVEDIIDTGKTLSYLLKYLEIKKPKSLKLCTLLDKPARRKIEGINVDYVGFTIPDYFVVGYGLDIDDNYRNLDSIKCKINNEDELKKYNEDIKRLTLRR